MPVQASQHNAANRYHHDQRSQYSLSASVPTLPMNNPMPSNLGFDASSSNSTAAHSTSKLPHGLTVHELKEMTKARLQAEAAEKLIAGFSDRPPSTTSMTERDSQDSRSTTPANYVQQMYAQDVRPVGTLATDSTSPTEVDFGGRQHAQVSPPPVAYQSFYPPNSSFNNIQDQKFVMGNRSRVHSCPDTQWDSTGLLGNRDRLGSFPEVVGNRNRIESLPELPIGNRSRVESYRELQGNRNRLDSFPDSNWESASVTSHNSTVASDYLGSECAYSSGTGAFSQRNADDFLPLNRTQSFPVGSSRSGSQEGLPQDNPCTSTSPLGNYFDPSSGMMQQNRGRSLTLSPRPGLSFLHEDRPGFSEEELGIPSFASSRLARQQIANRSRASPVLHPEGLPADSFGGIGSSSSGYIGSYGDNRPRTSSAASLPAISHTSEEFGGDFRGSAIRSHETIQNASSSLGEGLYGSSGLYNSDSAALGGASSVFRERSGGLPAPPGLSHPNSTNYNSSSDLNPLSSSNMGSAYSRVSNRARAATWNPGCDVFSSGPGLYECSGDDNLEEDLASILKLSGAEENRQDTGRSGSMFSDGLFSGSNEFKENDSRSRKF